MKRTAVLLINVGTPDSPSVADVNKFLSEFLNDKRVITLPAPLRWILVNLIIVPFRAKKSSALYQRLWTAEGSPLLHYSNKLLKKLNNSGNSNNRYFLGMRYGNPSIEDALKQIQIFNPEQIIVFPLYPQYASSTTESAFDAVKKELKTWKNKSEIKYIRQFYNQPEFIKVFTEQIRQHNPSDYDHIIFSYHGLPLSHLNNIHPAIDSAKCKCLNEIPKHGTFCYKATCYHTTRLLASELRLEKKQYSVAFQSRLNKNWISPFTDDVIVDLSEKGIKKILVIAPSFVTDCLETIVEIEDEYRELFIKNGGQKLSLVKSLNDSDIWIDALTKIIHYFLH